MISNISDVFFSFSLFSLLGWVMEVGYRSTRERRFVNPGLLSGPYLSLYGTAALILMGCIHLVHEYNILIKILFYFLITTGLELITGSSVQRFFNVRLWDYSDERLQFNGHICLRFSIFWIVLVFAFEYLLLLPYQNLLNSLALDLKGLVGATVTFIMIADFLLVIRRRRSHFAGTGAA